MYSLDEVRSVDPEIAEAIVKEQERQNSHIELIASENWVSKALSQINMRKGTRARDITAAVTALI